MDPLEYFKSLRLAPVKRSSREWACLPAWARLRLFFMSGVDNVEYLRLLYHVCLECMQHGTTEGEFLHRARTAIRENPHLLGEGFPTAEVRLNTWDPEDAARYERSTAGIDSLARLRLVFRTNNGRAFGYNNFFHSMQPEQLDAYPAWQFVRNPGARQVRKDHAKHEGEIRLKTDFAYWSARNVIHDGGFGMPFAPFGHNSFMDVSPLSWWKCHELGLVRRGQRIELRGSLRAQWGLDGIMPPIPTFVGATAEP